MHTCATHEALYKPPCRSAYVHLDIYIYFNPCSHTYVLAYIDTYGIHIYRLMHSTVYIHAYIQHTHVFTHACLHTTYIATLT